MKYIQIFDKKVIERTEGVPYLIRWNLLGLGVDSSLFSIKVHNILASDDACMHDHPWAFLSIILKGGYKETHGIKNLPPTDYMYDYCEKSKMHTITQKFVPGNILYRKANWIHKLEIDKDNPAWTLVFTFRKLKSWGFFTPKGFMNWKNYSKENDC